MKKTSNAPECKVTQAVSPKPSLFKLIKGGMEMTSQKRKPNLTQRAILWTGRKMRLTVINVSLVLCVLLAGVLLATITRNSPDTGHGTAYENNLPLIDGKLEATVPNHLTDAAPAEEARPEDIQVMFIAHASLEHMEALVYEARAVTTAEAFYDAIIASHDGKVGVALATTAPAPLAHFLIFPFSEESLALLLRLEAGKVSPILCMGNERYAVFFISDRP